MTKTEMIETIVNDAVRKSQCVEKMCELFGTDSQDAKEARHDWSLALNLVIELKLLDTYITKLRELDKENA